MKKLYFALFTATALLLTAACGLTVQPEVPTYQAETEETYTEFVTYPSIETMSPKNIDADKMRPPKELPLVFQADVVRKFKPIKAENSLMPDTYAEGIYKNGYDQYFVFSDKMAFVLLTDSDDEKKRTYIYSAYYNENGHLFYIGDDIYSWYYTDMGELDIIAYTYSFENTEVGTTFYDTSGKRIGAYCKGLYYDADLNVLDKEAELRLIQRLGAVAEIFK